MHAIPNKIGRVKYAPDYHSARRDIRVCMHAIPNKNGRVKNALKWYFVVRFLFKIRSSMFFVIPISRSFVWRSSCSRVSTLSHVSFGCDHLFQVFPKCGCPDPFGQVTHFCFFSCSRSVRVSWAHVRSCHYFEVSYSSSFPPLKWVNAAPFSTENGTGCRQSDLLTCLYLWPARI